MPAAAVLAYAMTSTNAIQYKSQGYLFESSSLAGGLGTVIKQFPGYV